MTAGWGGSMDGSSKSAVNDYPDETGSDQRAEEKNAFKTIQNKED